jgi:hypothetical protein
MPRGFDIPPVAAGASASVLTLIPYCSCTMLGWCLDGVGPAYLIDTLILSQARGQTSVLEALFLAQEWHR